MNLDPELTPAVEGGDLSAAEWNRLAAKASRVVAGEGIEGGAGGSSHFHLRSDSLELYQLYSDPALDDDRREYKATGKPVYLRWATVDGSGHWSAEADKGDAGAVERYRSKSAATAETIVFPVGPHDSYEEAITLPNVKTYDRVWCIRRRDFLEVVGGNRAPVPIEFYANQLYFPSVGLSWNDVTRTSVAWANWARKAASSETYASAKAVADFDGSSNPGIQVTSDGLYRFTWEVAARKGTSGWPANDYTSTNTGSTDPGVPTTVSDGTHLHSELLVTDGAHDHTLVSPGSHLHTYDKFYLTKAACNVVGEFYLAAATNVIRLNLYFYVLNLQGFCPDAGNLNSMAKVEGYMNLAANTKIGCKLRTADPDDSRGVQIHQQITKLIVERVGPMTGSADTT